MTTFTNKESTVLQALIDGLYAEPGFSDVTISDLVATTDLTMESVKGVLGSLTKKEAVFSDDEYRVSTDSGEMDGEVIIYLGYDFHKYHKEWAADDGIEFEPLTAPTTKRDSRFALLKDGPKFSS